MLLNCGVGEDNKDSKDIKSINKKANQPCVFIERTDAAAKAPKLLPLDVKSQLNGKDPDAEKN